MLTVFRKNRPRILFYKHKVMLEYFFSSKKKKGLGQMHEVYFSGSESRSSLVSPSVPSLCSGISSRPYSASEPPPDDSSWHGDLFSSFRSLLKLLLKRWGWRRLIKSCKMQACASVAFSLFCSRVCFHARLCGCCFAGFVRSGASYGCLGGACVFQKGFDVTQGT